MAKDFINIDSGFPSFMQDEPIEEKVSKLYNYTFMLLESLRYLLRNLDADNFNAAAVTEFKKAYEDKLTKAIADFEVKANEDYASAAMFSEFKTETEGNLKKQTDALSKFQTEVSKDYAKISGLAEYDTIKEIDGKVSENTSAIAGVKGTADKNAASLEEITEWKGSKYESFEGGLEAAKSAAEAAANGYTDGKITEAKTDIESKVYTKTQADSEFAKSETLTSYQSEVTQKFSDADSAAQGYAESAGANAKDAANDYTDDRFSVLSESFTDIEQKSDANGAFIKMMVGQAVKLVNGVLTGTDNTTITSASAAEFVMEAANGESEIKLKADRIKLGDGAGVDNDGNLMIKRLWSSGDTANYYAKIYSSYGDFGVYESGAPKNATPVNESCLWGLYNTLADGLSFYTKGKEYLLLKESEGVVTVKPKGTWNFSSSEVSGLAVYFS